MRVLKYSLKLELYAISLSPILMIIDLPRFCTDFLRIGSNEGSISSSISSRKTEYPRRIASSRISMYFFWGFAILISGSIIFTQVLAWCCGSIKSGHRLDRRDKIAFSVENLSVGSFFRFQSLISVGEDMKSVKVNSGIIGISFLLTRGTHFLSTRSSR